MNYIGLDIHKKNTQACVKDENGKVIVNERFPSDVVAIKAFLDRLGGAEAKIVMEATGFYQYIYETIEARGFQVMLAHPLKLKALTAGRAKTDHNDAEMLAELLRINAIPVSYVPPKDIRELRDLTRHRSSLIAESTTLKNKIHAELAIPCLVVGRPLSSMMGRNSSRPAFLRDLFATKSPVPSTPSTSFVEKYPASAINFSGRRPMPSLARESIRRSWCLSLPSFTKSQATMTWLEQSTTIWTL
jgi:hypothetical protein